MRTVEGPTRSDSCFGGKLLWFVFIGTLYIAAGAGLLGR